MPTIDEIAPDVFRISTFIPKADIAFSQFLVRDEAPLLFHTGPRALFPAVRDAVAKLIDPKTLKYISFSHFEADECGALNEWIALAPSAIVVCTRVGALVNVNDFASKPAQPQDEPFSTGRYSFRYLTTPQVPHAWDAGLLFEETNRTLFCSDLFHQAGDRPAIVETDIVGAARELLEGYEKTIFANYMPVTPRTQGVLYRLAAMAPTTVATMHGSCFRGDGAGAIRELADVIARVGA